jgi:hypothetical protein
MRPPRFGYSRISQSAFSLPEAFVFVSAFLRVYFFSAGPKTGFQAARAATVSRAFRIYRAHLITLVFALWSGASFAQLPESALLDVFRPSGIEIFQR